VIRDGLSESLQDLISFLRTGCQDWEYSFAEVFFVCLLDKLYDNIRLICGVLCDVNFLNILYNV